MDPDFADSCGRCYEVACEPGTVVDGFGEELDRADACRNGSVVVRVTDSCPCVKPENPESNKRWAGRTAGRAPCGLAAPRARLSKGRFGRN
jgi:hypothetical protein